MAEHDVLPVPLKIATPSQAESYAAIVQKYTFSIVLIYVLGVLSGYFPFRPFDLLAAATASTKERLDTDKRIAGSLETFAIIANRYERRDRLVECHARYTADPKARDWCLNLGADAPR